jgi:hypothetical protein
MQIIKLKGPFLMNLKRNRIILLAILALLFPVVIYSQRMGPALSMAALLAILIIYLVAVHFLWCCPHCGHALGKPSSVPTHCPYCEKEL